MGPTINRNSSLGCVIAGAQSKNWVIICVYADLVPILLNKAELLILLEELLFKEV